MNQLKTKIEEVKAKLGLTQMQLSERIGKNPYYLDTVKHRGVTTERQEELIRELDLVTNGGTVMTEREIIAELTEKADALQSRLNSAQAAIEALKEENSVAIKDRNELHLDVAYLLEYKRQYRDLVATVLVIGIIVILGLVIWSVVK